MRRQLIIKNRKGLRNSFIERLNEMFGDNKGYSPFTKKYYFEYVK